MILGFGCVEIHDSMIWIVLLIFLLGFIAGFLICLLLGILEMTKSYKDRYERFYPPQ